MNNIRQCARCRKLFQYCGSMNCPACVRELDDIFTAVRNMIFDDKDATMEEIIEKTGAEESDILRWLREGRLIAAAGGPALLKCGRCGKRITGGMYCDQCAAIVKDELDGVAQSIIERGGLRERKSAPSLNSANADQAKRIHVTRTGKDNR